MTAGKSVKRGEPGEIVGVITTVAELHQASLMRRLPDLFEIRLDHLVDSVNELESKMSILRRPIILTARHPNEGGVNKLSIKRRRELLLRFLPHARYIDAELRSVGELRAVIARAREREIKCIMSFHDFDSMPDTRSLHTKAMAAKRHGADFFKIAVRTETPAQLDRLRDFAANPNVDLALSVMGIGKLGAKSRLVLARHSAHLYAAIGEPRVQGQPSVAQLRRKIAGIG